MPIPKEFNDEKIMKLKHFFDRRIKKLNPDTLTITGGEPTLVKEFPEFLEYARKELPKTKIVVLSNARMFSYKKYVERIAELNLSNFEIDVNLIAPTPELHDSITQVKGSWEQTIQGIKNLADSGIKVNLRIVIHRLNYKTLPELASFISRELVNVKKIIFIFALLQGNAFFNRERVSIKYKNVTPLLKEAVNILKNNFEVELYHFPFCILDECLHKFAKPTLEKWKVLFLPQCSECKLRNNCVGILKTYAFNEGVDEFKK
jgi:His-Xaa-Ser system radical SAM maturase HxsC